MSELSNRQAELAELRELTVSCHRQTFGAHAPDDGSLASIGLTVALWRNSVVEDLHAGGDPGRRADDDELRRREGWAPVTRTSGIPDEVMLQLNVSTFRQLRSLLRSRGLDPDALGRRLCDPRRVLTLGPVTVEFGELFAPVWDELIWDADGCLSRQPGKLAVTLEMVGRETLWQGCELFAASYASHWFGTPWWTQAVDRAVTTGAIPTTLDVAALKERPDRLDADEAAWLSWNFDFRDLLEEAKRDWQRERTGGEVPAAPHPWMFGLF
jgi:hypothetical protein